MGDGPGGALLVLLRSLALFGLLAEALVRAGIAAVSLTAVRRVDPLMTAGQGFLVGLGCLGFSLLGLSLVGLFYPSAIVLVLVLLVAGSRRVDVRRWEILRAARDCLRVGPLGAAVLACTGVVLLVATLSPDLTMDSHLYHLGIPWQYLQAHRAILDAVPWIFHLPSLVEMSFAVPVLAGDVRMAKWIVAGSFMAAMAVFAAWRDRGDGRMAAWLGVLAALSMREVFGLAASSKTDVVASAMLVTGMLLTLDRSRVLGMCLLGLAIDAKAVYAPAVCVWIVLMGSSPRAKIAGIGVCVLTVMPWLMKAFLATGNPFFPFLPRLIPSPMWTELNDAALGLYLEDLWGTKTWTLPTVIRSLYSYLSGSYLIVLLLLPGLAMFGGQRRAVLACLVAQVSTVMTAHAGRYLLPMAWFLALLAAKEAVRVRGPLGRWGVPLLAGFCAVMLSWFSGIGDREWRRAAVAAVGKAGSAPTRFEEAMGFVRDRSEGGRIMCVGMYRLHGVPGRALFGGFDGETPLIWKLVRESDDVSRLAVRFKQTGAGLMGYNYVRADWLAVRYEPFRWDQRMLDVYRDFCRTRLEVMMRSGGSDQTSGGFNIYRVHDRPMSVPQRIWFMPGIESLFAGAFALESAGRHREALAAYKGIAGRLPGVGFARSMIAHAYATLGDPSTARKYLEMDGARH